MLLRLLFAFTFIPLVELLLLIQIGKHVGLGWTLALVISTGLAGAWLARREGLHAVRRLLKDFLESRGPADSLIDGGLILVAGCLLITPGILTDLAGFALLTSSGRALCWKYLKRRFKHWVVFTPTSSTYAPYDQENPPTINATVLDD